MLISEPLDSQERLMKQKYSYVLYCVCVFFVCLLVINKCENDTRDAIDQKKETHLITLLVNIAAQGAEVHTWRHNNNEGYYISVEVPKCYVVLSLVVSVSVNSAQAKLYPNPQSNIAIFPGKNTILIVSEDRTARQDDETQIVLTGRNIPTPQTKLCIDDFMKSIQI